jgi:hypothetical protein
MELHLSAPDFRAQALAFCALWRSQPGLPADWAWAEPGAAAQRQLVAPEVGGAVQPGPLAIERGRQPLLPSLRRNACSRVCGPGPCARQPLSRTLLLPAQGGYLEMRRVPLACLAGPGKEQQRQRRQRQASTGASGTSPESAAGGEAAQECGLDTAAAVAAAAATGTGRCRGAVVDLHVLLHPSYQVPTLLLRPCWGDGSPIGAAELQQLLRPAPAPGAQPGGSAASPGWAHLEPLEHPLLHRPWLCLHPCQTARLMGTMLLGQQGGSGGAGAEHPARASLALPAGAACQAEAASAVDGSSGTEQVPGTATITAEAGGTGTADEGGAAFNAGPAGAAANAAGAADVRSSSNTDGCRYLCSWFSVVGPVIGLPLPTGMWPAASC